jgi:hypothetical protein
MKYDFIKSEFITYNLSCIQSNRSNFNFDKIILCETYILKKYTKKLL